jgi:putative transposase
LFPSPRSYDEFVDLLEAGVHRYGVRVCSYCALETHWHQAIWVRQDDGAAAVSKYLRWLSSCHALRFRFTTETRGQGHVYQDRYKARPVQDDAHYLTLVRYIEANPVVAGLVERAEQWPWSSFAERMSGRRRILDDGPVRLPEDWSDIVNASVELELPDFMAPQTTERRRRRRSRWSGTEVLRPGTEVAR